jgi:hypothetical protein
MGGRSYPLGTPFLPRCDVLDEIHGHPVAFQLLRRDDLFSELGDKAEVLGDHPDCVGCGSRSGLLTDIDM